MIFIFPDFDKVDIYITFTTPIIKIKGDECSVKMQTKRKYFGNMIKDSRILIVIRKKTG